VANFLFSFFRFFSLKLKTGIHEILQLNKVNQNRILRLEFHFLILFRFDFFYKVIFFNKILKETIY